MDRDFVDVHDRHCCKRHSYCKYGAADCTVVNGPNTGIHAECCDSEEENMRNFLASGTPEARAISLLKDYQRLIKEGKPTPSAETVLRMIVGVLDE